MDLELTGKVALITGSGQGIGREIAKTLASEGVIIAVNDYYEERANKVAEEIKQMGQNAEAFQSDIIRLEQVKEMMAQITKQLGPVDILVNNAGVPIEIREGRTPRTLFIDSDREAWDQQINLNYYGVLNCVHAV